MARTEDGFGGQGKDLLPVGLEAVGVGNHRSADRSGKKRVSDHSDRALESADHIGDPSGGMTSGEAGFDPKGADREFLAGSK
jgi:hypothetical protein